MKRQTGGQPKGTRKASEEGKALGNPKAAPFHCPSPSDCWVCPRCGSTDSRYDDGLTWCTTCRFWVEGKHNATRHVSARSDDNVNVIVRQGGSDGV